MKADYEGCCIILKCYCTSVITILTSQIKTLEEGKGEQKDNMFHLDSYLSIDSLKEINKVKQMEVNNSDPSIDNKKEDPKVDNDVSCLNKVLDEINIDVSKVKDREDDECEDVDVCSDDLCIKKKIDANSPQEVKVLPNAADIHIWYIYSISHIIVGTHSHSKSRTSLYSIFVLLHSNIFNESRL